MVIQKSQDEIFAMKEVHERIGVILKNLGKKLGERSIVALIIASLFQVIILLRLDTKNNFSIGFFSWNQAINDAIILGTPIFILYIALSIGVFFGGFIGNRMKNHKSKLLYRSVIFFTAIANFMVSLLLVFVLGINMFVIIPLGFGLAFGTISGIDIKIKNRKEIISDLTGIVFAGTSLIILSYQSSFFRNLYVQTNQKEEIKIEYMNDQYIFSSGTVYSKDGGMKFYGK